MAIPCPCCKASNEIGPTCRRCKADLAMLFAIEAERTELMEEARRLVNESRFEEAHAALERADQSRRGDDVARLRAMALLLNRDFAGALRVYDELATPTTTRHSSP